MHLVLIVVGVLFAVSGGYLYWHTETPAPPPPKVEPVQTSQEERVVLYFATSSIAEKDPLPLQASTTLDISAEIEAMQNATGDAKAVQCAACDQLLGDARGQCREALSCN